ncbi:MAG TPA: MCE family protein [Acetobacteraceae bacterium]|jgi:paraquat-inducible protein B|nr:MCE family protein [Acetobacteraceae bacterium]
MKASTQAWVGAFVLGGIALALGAIILFGNLNLFNPSIKAAVVFQDSIAGLAVGAPVTFRGVRVGAVETIGIEFDPKTQTAYIPVTVRLTPSQPPRGKRGEYDPGDISELLKRGLRAELNLQSFVTGQSQIDLDFDPSSPAILHPDITSLPEIPVRQSTLQRARQQLSELPLRELSENTVATLNSLRSLTERLNRDLPPLVESLKATTDRTGQTAEATNQAIRDLQGKLATTLDAIGRVADTGTQQLQQRGGDLHLLLANSDRTMTQMRELVAQLKTMTSDRSASRANIESILRDLAAAAASLRGFASDVEHDPQLLLTGRKP